jgi:hypothetical protein
MELGRRFHQSPEIVVEVIFDRDTKNLEIGGVVVVSAKVEVPRVVFDLVNNVVFGLSHDVPSSFGAIDSEKVDVAIGLPGAL